jgi:hypothetical protein
VSVLDATAPNYVPVRVLAPDAPQSGEIWSASERFLRVRMRSPLEAREQIELSIEGCAAYGEVVFCQECSGGYNIGLQLLDHDSIRREPRFPVDLPAVLTVVGTPGPCGIPIRIADVSASGVGLFGSGPIEIGACVQVNLDLGVLFGEVRYCLEADGGQFRLGVAIYHVLARDQAEKPAPFTQPMTRFKWLRRTAFANGRGREQTT